MPPVIIGIVAAVGAIGSAVAAGGLVGSLLMTGIMMGASMLIDTVAKLFHHPSSIRDNGSSQLSFREPISARRVIYGSVRAGGIITDMHLTGSSNEYMHLVITLAGHQVNAISTTIHIDGVDVPMAINAGGATDGAYHPTGGKYYQHMAAEFDLGDPNNAGQPFPLFVSDDAAHWTAAHKQQGCAKVHLRFRWESTVYTNGMPSAISFDIQGKKIYDPRTATTVFSNNPALCVRDFLTDTRYGFGVPSGEIDDTTVIAAANLCEEQVTKKAGGAHNRYACDGSFGTGTPRGDVLNALRASMAGFIIPPGDSWRIFGGAYTNPVLSLTDSDLTGPIKYDARVSRRSLANGVKGSFVSPSNNWGPTDFTPHQSATYLAADGEAIWTDIALDFTTDDIRAQRLAKIHLEKLRRQNPLALQCNMVAFPLQPGETFEFTHPRFGFANKVFMCVSTGVDAAAGANGPVLSVPITAVPMDPSVYAWTAATDEGSPALPGTVKLPDASTVVAPASLAVFNVEALRNDGLKHLQLRVSWTSPADQFVLSGGKIQVWLADTSVGNWRMVAVADGADTVAYITQDIADGSAYDIRICAVNSHGSISAFVELDNFLATAAIATLDNFLDGATYKRPAYVDADHTFHVSSALVKQGSIASAGVNAFHYDAYPTSITWSWTPFSVYAPDGTVYNFGSGDVDFIGLTANRTYHFGLYVTLADLSVRVAKSGQISGASKESPAVQATVYNGDGNVCISPDVAVATPSSGSGAGTGGGSCFSGNTRVLVQGLGPVRFDALKPGDRVLTARSTWRTVLLVHAHELHSGLMLDMGRGELVTPTHPILAGGRWVRARAVFAEVVEVKGMTVYNATVEAEDPGTGADTERSYTLANGYVAHNIKLIF